MVKSAGMIPAKRDRTRAALLEAAIEIIAERGLESIGIDDLTRSAGMARGTFYNYFETREDVVRAVGELIKQRYEQQVIDRVPMEHDDAATIACILYGFLQFGINNPSLGWALVHIGGGMHWVSSERSQRADETLQNLLGETTSLLLGRTYVEGAALMILRRCLEGRMTLTEAEEVLKLALRGLGIPINRIPALLNKARAFAKTLQDRNLNHLRPVPI
jgi:AcrR family transcriptional regulator